MLEKKFTFEEVKTYLNYENEFWNFINKKIKFIDGSVEENKFFYSTLMKFDFNNNLKDIKVIVPFVTDLKTALVNIHEFCHAHDLYLMMGKPITNEQEYEERAIQKENNFTKKIYKKGE